jgi:hypothetical protein
MQLLLALVRNRIEAIIGKRFPRRVTNISGRLRWQGRNGRTFDTREEAYSR